MPPLTAVPAIAALFAPLAFASPVRGPVGDLIPLLDDTFGQVANRYGWDIPILPEYIRKVQPDEVVELVELDTNNLASNLTTTLSSLADVDMQPFSGSIPNNNVLGERQSHGNDDRYQYTDRNFPWRAAGKIISPVDGGSCSASIVGPRQVLTAKHCVPENIGGWATTFYPAYDNGDAPFGSAPVVKVIRTPGGYNGIDVCSSKSDWALLVLNESIGNRVGYLGVRPPDGNKIDQEILTTIAYPCDKDGCRRPYRQDRIRAYGNFSSCDNAEPFTPLWSNSDGAGGGSGSPLWDPSDNRVWGAVSARWVFGGQTFRSHSSGNMLAQAVADSRRTDP